MKIVIDKDREYDFPDNDVAGTRNENKVTELKIEVPEKYQNWNKRIVFITPDGKPWYYIENDTFTLTNEITKYGEVDAYIWLTEHSESEEESVGDFRSKIFPLTFYDNENTDNYEPSPNQVDGFNGLITVLNEELEEIKTLETTIEQAEQSREQRTNEAINNIVDMTDAYNQNASDKTNDFNTNAQNKTEDFDDFADERQDEIQAICDTARDFVSAVTFTTIEENFETGNLEVNNEESLGNMGFQFNYDTGNLEVEING